MAILFFNTMTRRKEEFVPLVPNEVRMYTCGPTVYDFAHIGNFRTYIFEDLLRRYLKYRGYKVTQVMNITDVDDKTIRGSRAKKTSLNEYTRKYIKSFFEDLDTLGIERAEFYPRATECIPEMIEIIAGLIEKGYGYKGDDGSVYYNIAKFKDYGKLAHINVDELQAGKRVSHDEYTKDTAADFALWKAWDEDDGDVAWESPFGKGRPGWHIECSAMSRKYLADSFDIHTGAVDNIFPHHQNEIAQSEAFTGKRFVKYWIHSEWLLSEGRKMSKSLGNFYTLRDLISKGYTGREVRFLLINSHYSQPLNFTIEGMNAARNSLRRIDDFTHRLHSANGSRSGEIGKLVEKTEKSIVESLDDDLNMPAATGFVFELILEVNRLLDDAKVNSEEAKMLAEFIKKMNCLWNVFDLTPPKKVTASGAAAEWQVPPDTPENIVGMLNERNHARSEKDFKKADELRNMLMEMGYIIEDIKSGGGRLKKR
jgi:cysteinyl-tRNA synthetase